jgi:hypothetical protein
MRWATAGAAAVTHVVMLLRAQCTGAAVVKAAAHAIQYVENVQYNLSCSFAFVLGAATCLLLFLGSCVCFVLAWAVFSQHDLDLFE